jgi:phosphoribosylamine--glycine ligase
MRILVVGGGGREHALVWKIAQSPLAEKVFCAPGNPGIARLAENVAIPGDDVDGLARWAVGNGIALVVVGPETPLVLGLADRLTEAGIPVFGPSAAAAQLEGSKAFAKEVMREASIPTADHGAFDTLGPALARARAAGGRVVVKADGLAAGKGVVVCSTLPEAEEALRAILVDRVHGTAGSRVVVEERLEGPEVSVIALVDGERVLVLPPAQDHKRIFDGDGGPNTGGMGAFSPTPTVDEAFLDDVRDRVLLPTVREMARRGTPFRGALYAGLMLTRDGLRVLEFNARFGDPETQPIVMRLAGDLVPALLGAARGDLSGDAIEGAEGPFPPGVQIFQAGTRRGADGRLVTSGGRVLTVCALGTDRAEAAARAYETVSRVRFRGSQYRRDIGRTGPGEAR